jgi:hypothetical protein
MRANISELTKEELEVLARVRMSVTANLIAAASAIDPETRALCESNKRPFGIALSVAGMAGSVRILCKEGHANVAMGAAKAGLAGRAGLEGRTNSASSVKRTSLHLLFASPKACVRVLSGAMGLAIPIPLGLGFRQALDFFQTAAKRLPLVLTSQATSAEEKAKLLLIATLSGLSAVSGDPYLDRRMEHIPDGSALVSAGSTRMWVDKIGNAITVREEIPDEKPSAILSFASPEAAIAILSGRKQAVVALGSGEVSIAGLLPLVQGLFAVLDRLSWYLAVEVEKDGAAEARGRV